MASLKDSALNYEAPTTKNIADLDKVSTDLDVVTEEHTKSDGDKFKVDVIEVEGQKYRVPATVLANLKVMLEENPSLKHFKVKKSGTGMSTQYTVVPLSE